MNVLHKGTITTCNKVNTIHKQINTTGDDGKTECHRRNTICNRINVLQKQLNRIRNEVKIVHTKICEKRNEVTTLLKEKNTCN